MSIIFSYLSFKVIPKNIEYLFTSLINSSNFLLNLSLSLIVRYLPKLYKGKGAVQKVDYFEVISVVWQKIVGKPLANNGSSFFILR